MQIEYFIGPATELVAVFVGILNYRKFDRTLLWFFYFVCFGCTMDITLNILVEVFDVRKNLEFLHIYVPIEFLLIALAYYSALKSHVNKAFLLILVIVFELFCVVNPIFMQELHEYSSARAISSVLLILFSILYYHKVMVESKVRALSTEPMIWINTAVLVYFAGNLFFNLLFSLILEYSREFSKLTTYYFVILVALFYLLIAIGFWKAGRQK